MPLEPSWWYGKRGSFSKVMPTLLSPLATIYGRSAASRMAQEPAYRSKLPVVCAGNFTSGGGGKTPTVIAVAALLKAMGKTPAFLTRGYGGSAKGVIRVAGHDATDVGDEALLLAGHAPTFVSADRPAGAEAIEKTDANVIVMDDGFQNPGLAKNLSLIVVDAGSGLGNGQVIPSGPLRAPLAAQLPYAHALLVIGEGKKGDALLQRFEAAGKPALRAKIAPNCDARWLTVLPTIGFAGIARPSKFFATLKSNGARLVSSHSFGDHHRFTEKEARRLLDEAETKKAMLVTTEKDWVRLSGGEDEDDSALAELKMRSRPFPIVIAFDDEEAVTSLLEDALDKAP